jgi:hypothetical protein
MQRIKKTIATSLFTFKPKLTCKTKFDEDCFKTRFVYNK